MDPNFWIKLVELAPNYALAGVCLYMMWKLATNHVEHNTQAISKLTEAVIELKAWLEARDK